MEPWSPGTLEFWGPWKRWSLPCSHGILESWNLEAAKPPRQLAALAGNNLLLLGCKAGLICQFVVLERNMQEEGCVDLKIKLNYLKCFEVSDF